MTSEGIVLLLSAPIFLGVAVQGLFLPKRIVEPLGGSLNTPSMANEIRANYGGMHLGIAALMVVGAFRVDWQMPMLALLAVFTAGLCVGRAVSWVADGAPNRYLKFFFGLEALGGIVALALLWRGLGQ